MEFTPIILSGGEGAKLYPLAEQIPKPLLPIANRPLIWYVLALLEKSGFQKVYIIVQQSVFDKINFYLNPTLHNLKIETELVSLPAGNYKMGTADALRFIAPRIKTNFLILPCDVLTDVCLQSLADIHRCYNSTLTVLLSPTPAPTSPQLESSSPGSSKTLEDTRDIIGLSEDEERLLVMENEYDLENNLTIPRSLLRRYSCFDIRTDLKDTHIYMLSRSVLSILSEDESKHISSIKDELIPELLRRQLISVQTSELHNITTANENIEYTSTFDLTDQLDLLATQLSESDKMKRFEVKNSFPKTANYYPHACYCMILPHPLTAIRVSTVSDYFEANKLMQKEDKRCELWPFDIASNLIHPSAIIQGQEQKIVSGETYIANDCTIEDCSIKRCTIGPLCHVKKGARIVNSVLMERIVIEERCQISNSIVCGNVRIEADSIIKECIIAKYTVIQKKSDLKGETILSDDMIFHI